MRRMWRKGKLSESHQERGQVFLVCFPCQLKRVVTDRKDLSKVLRLAVTRCDTYTKRFDSQYEAVLDIFDFSAPNGSDGSICVSYLRSFETIFGKERLVNMLWVI